MIILKFKKKESLCSFLTKTLRKTLIYYIFLGVCYECSLEIWKATNECYLCRKVTDILK